MKFVSRMRGDVWFCVSAMLLLGTCRTNLVAEKNILKVISPDSLKGAYECATEKIGIPLYGGTMAGILAYPKSNRNACKSYEEFYISFKAKPGGLPTFLLVDRGDCYFTTKAWNAQNAGAVAIIVVDDNEDNFTMNMPKNSGWHDYSRNLSIPSAFIKQSLGDSLKKVIDNGEMVNLNMNWRESFPRTYDRVEYEFWTNSNDECGPRCDRQRNFVRNFKGAAQLLEKKGYTRFIPHYITWNCLLISSKQCKSECINHGRYCSPDPEHDFSIGYDGRDVVIQNLRQVCLFKVSNESGKPWIWWDYASDFALRCPMKDMKYTEECAEEVISSLGVDLKKINDCIGDPEADEDNPVLKAEQNAQNGKGSHGHVSILGTLVINNRLYRGKLDKSAVLKAICSEFEETTEPTMCLTEDIETNECLENNGGCWIDRVTNITACKDTFRGRLCKCPTVNGVKFFGDGYKYCEASGPRRCEINNGGCWKENRDGLTFSACSAHEANGCKCPPGFKGDGVHMCEDVDECKEMTGCQCQNCKCKNTWGSYECSCRGDLLYMHEHDLCISKRASTEIAWMLSLAIFPALAVAGVVGYALYIFWIRRHWRSEIRSFMVQYMPLENHWRSTDDIAGI